MDTTYHEIIAITRRVVMLQIITGILAISVAFFGGGWLWVMSTGYGVIASIILALLLSLSVMRTAGTVVYGYKQFFSMAYTGAAQRFILVLLWFAGGIKSFGLVFFPMIIGFFCAQLAYFLGARLKPY